MATPALGAKTVFVPWFTTLLLATRLPWQLWCAAALSFCAIVLLNRNPGERSHLRRRHRSLAQPWWQKALRKARRRNRPAHHHPGLGQTLLFSLLAAGRLRALRRARAKVVAGLGRRPLSAHHVRVFSGDVARPSPLLPRAVARGAARRLARASPRAPSHGASRPSPRLRPGSHLRRRHRHERRPIAPRRVERRRGLAHRPLVCQHRKPNSAPVLPPAHRLRRPHDLRHRPRRLPLKFRATPGEFAERESSYLKIIQHFQSIVFSGT